MNRPSALVFATNNRHKLDEVRHMLGDIIQLKSLADVGYTNDIPENEATFEGNALVKARTIFEYCGEPCIADDSGLRVKALHGEPGVYSARYAGEPKNDENNLQKVLRNLQGVSNREAEFVTVIAYINNGLEYIFEGVVKGEIMQEKRGDNGFGSDPIFKPAGYEKTYAEMTSSEKNGISHRARAVRAFAEFLTL